MSKSVARREDAGEGQEREAWRREDGGQARQALDRGPDALGDTVARDLLHSVGHGDLKVLGTGT